MFPYRDENETQRRPYVTVAIIALNLIAWLFFQGAGQNQAHWRPRHTGWG